MADNEVVVRDVTWSRVLSVGHLLRAFRIALWPPSKLFLCFLALAITIGAGLLLDKAFQTDVNDQSFGQNMLLVYRLAMGQGGSPELSMDNLLAGRGFYYAPLDALKAMLGLTALYWQEATWFALIQTAIALLVWTFFGGAVCRMAALQFSRDERPTMGEALRFACKRYGSLLASPVALFIVIALMAIPTFLVCALLLWIPGVGEVLTGVFFLLALVLGVVLAFLFLFGVSSLGLQMPAIGAEGRDAFDAISRGVSYVWTRPWKYILYTLFSVLYMCLTFVLVRLFAFLALKIPYTFIKLWPWVGREAEDGSPGKLARVWVEPNLYELFRMPDSSGSEYFAAVLIGIVVFIFLGLMIAFIPSFLLTSQTIVYFLLRRQIDFKDLDDVYTEEGDEAAAAPAVEKTEEPVVQEPSPAEEEASEDESK